MCCSACAGRRAGRFYLRTAKLVLAAVVLGAVIALAGSTDGRRLLRLVAELVFKGGL